MILLFRLFRCEHKIWARKFLYSRIIFLTLLNTVVTFLLLPPFRTMRIFEMSIKKWTGFSSNRTSTVFEQLRIQTFRNPLSPLYKSGWLNCLNSRGKWKKFFLAFFSLFCLRNAHQHDMLLTIQYSECPVESALFGFIFKLKSNRFFYLKIK